MKPPIQVVVVAAIAAVLPELAVAQPKGDELTKITSCAVAHRSGRRIVSNLEIVEFYVPRFGHMTKVVDVDYVDYHVRYGPKRDNIWLKLMFGPMVGGHSPHALGDTSIRWTARTWGCHKDRDGTDWRGIGDDGRKWRHLSVPFGFAAYEGVPANAADYFDNILDTMCCGRCPYCKK